MNALLEQIWAKKLVFLGTFFLVFTISYCALVAIDFLPEAPAESSSDGATEELSEVVAEESTDTEEPAASTEVVEAVVLPTEIHIARLDKTVTVLNPTSRTIADLDAALLDGVVRHPDSATLGQDGTVFILGHSSYLPNVFNPNFQAFNGIQDLEWGDTIELTSGELVYEYRVEKVYRANAQDVTVPIAGTGQTLTLATCNSFGSIDDRYIVEAKQVVVRAL